jgi:hypothetical protein
VALQANLLEQRQRNVLAREEYFAAQNQNEKLKHRVKHFAKLVAQE